MGGHADDVHVPGRHLHDEQDVQALEEDRVQEANGIRGYRIQIAFLIVVALATTMTVPVTGALLIFSLMIGPPAAARSFTSRPLLAMALSVAIALITVWAAIAASYLVNWPVGFFVGTLAALSYGTGRGWATWRRTHTGTRPATAPPHSQPPATPDRRPPGRRHSHPLWVPRAAMMSRRAHITDLRLSTRAVAAVASRGRSSGGACRSRSSRRMGRPRGEVPAGAGPFPRGLPPNRT